MDVDAYMGEIRIWAGTRCPQDWHFCDGSLLKINDYQALYALIGVTYGGDGVTTFALPDLRGKAPIHKGQGTNLTNRVLGQTTGSETVTVSSAQMAGHSHYYMASTTAAAGTSPEGAVTGNVTSANLTLYANESGAGTQSVMDANMIGATGGGAAHSNLMPTMALNMIIALAGIFPQQS